MRTLRGRSSGTGHSPAEALALAYQRRRPERNVRTVLLTTLARTYGHHPFVLRSEPVVAQAVGPDDRVALTVVVDGDLT